MNREQQQQSDWCTCVISTLIANHMLLVVCTHRTHTHTQHAMLMCTVMPLGANERCTNEAQLSSLS